MSIIFTCLKTDSPIFIPAAWIILFEFYGKYDIFLRRLVSNFVTQIYISRTYSLNQKKNQYCYLLYITSYVSLNHPKRINNKHC